MNEFLLYLSQRLTSPRLHHSQEVMRVMVDLVDIYGLERDQALTAGLLHDVAKDLNQEQLLDLAKEGEIELSDPCDRHPVYLHALVGSYLARRDLDISDQEVLRAIAAHSYARDGLNGNTRLPNCLRVADILAPVEVWEGIQKLIGYAAYLASELAGVPLFVESQEQMEAVLLFVNNLAEVSRLTPDAFCLVLSDGLLWIAYPKGSSGIKTDVNRDILWKTVESIGWRPVRQIAFNEVWSAMRFRPADQVDK